ncbi:HYD1 signature containing ADP-ribosyltransferase family protein [Streptomyces toxytricini]|uniref:HYD1 signature containing ADP-ribosyltransferase family protein n=1 Tax=Streptomyces toxytricini TaxID=67369 RepID=A0ABW8ERQ1_STRT5
MPYGPASPPNPRLRGRRPARPTGPTDTAAPGRRAPRILRRPTRQALRHTGAGGRTRGGGRRPRLADEPIRRRGRECLGVGLPQQGPTNEQGYKGILDSEEMRPSVKASNSKDSRFGDGQYQSDIEPGTRTLGQLSAAFLRVPWQGRKFAHYFENDVTGLEVWRSVVRPDVYLILNDQNLDLIGRIVSHGKG